MSPQPAKSQIGSLIQLLDDRDAYVRGQVREAIIAQGEDALPFLEMASRGDNETVRAQARELLKVLLPLRLAEKFRALSPVGLRRDVDLEAGALLLVEFGYPAADGQAVSARLDHLAGELAARLAGGVSPLAAVNALSDFLFVEKGFRGNRENYSDPDNSYLNRVLETGRGIPISLSAVCLFVGWRLGLPLEGVALPGHYIVKHKVPGNDIFFDPFHGGRILSAGECANLVESFGHAFSEVQLAAASHRETLVRMLNNLIRIYRDGGEARKADQLANIVGILTGEIGRRPGKPA